VIVALDRALVSLYRLSIVTMLLTEAVWPQFAVQVIGGMGVYRGSELVPQGSGRATQFFGKTYRLATIYDVTDDRQTDGRHVVP